MVQNAPKIVVIGATYVDIAVKCRSYPASGQTVAGASFSYSPTGPGTNEAVQAAFCDCQVHLISKVGGDLFSKFIKDNLTRAKVNVDFIYTAEAKSTGTIVTLVNAEGENASCICSGANLALTPQEIASAEQVISEANLCLIHGGLPEETIKAAIGTAKIHGVKVILNPAVPIDCAGGKNRTLPIEYFNADFLIPNLSEAARITQQSQTNLKTAKLIGSDLLARGASCVVITMGRRGTIVADRNGASHIPAFQVELVDRTGAGDAFAGALAAYCAVSDNIREAVKFASAAGALACTKFGSVEALPSKAEIIQLLQKDEPGFE